MALATAGAMNLGPAATPASAQSAVSVSLFYEHLAPHGRWFQHPRWGWAWFPLNAGADWRPYSRGNWVWTDEYGWYWVSNEPFGWATYHYGRWAYDEQYGWIWIPGGTWGPAWVAFRYGDDDIGWAPLPPETIDASYGWDPVYTDLAASYYVPRWLFVPRRHFLSHRVYAYAAASARNGDFIGRTRNVTRYERGRRGVFNRSIDPKRLEAALGRRIVAARVSNVSGPRQVGPDRAGRMVKIFRPNVRMTRDTAPANSARAKPQDRPRAVIRRDEVAPSDRRAARGTASPPGPAITARPPVSKPEPRVGRERRVAPPDRAPGAGPKYEPRFTQPAPGALPPQERGRYERAPRFAQPAPRSLPVKPPSMAQPRYVRPQPPHVAPGAPPQYRAQPHAAPKQGPPPRQGPAKAGPAAKQDDKGKGR